MKVVIRNITLLVLLILIFGGSYYSYATEGVVYSIVSQDLDPIIEFINSFGALAAIVFLALVTIEVVAAPIPPLVLYIAGGLIFGTLLGGTLALVGNVLGSAIAFLIARRFGRKWVEKNTDKKARLRFDKFSEKYGALSIFLLRINPITSSDVFSYLAGLSKMRMRSLLIGTILGLAPIIYIQTYIGNDLIKDNPFLTLVFIWIGLVYLVILVWGLLKLKKKGKKK